MISELKNIGFVKHEFLIGFLLNHFKIKQIFRLLINRKFGSVSVKGNSKW